MKQDLLIELGTEELPPTALSKLSHHFSKNILSLLKEADLDSTESQSFATPRRLAILIKGLDDKQQDKEVTKKGPPVKACYDSDGNYDETETDTRIGQVAMGVEHKIAVGAIS